MAAVDARLETLRRQYPRDNGDSTVPAQTQVHTVRYLGFRHGREGATPYVVDWGFPATLQTWRDFAGVDEHTADLLYGLVRALHPRRCLETGTHKGRSARAIVAALHANARVPLMPQTYIATFAPGHLWTVDAEDWAILTSGAIPPDQHEYVTPILGWTPEVFTKPPLDTLEGIDFAFLDGDHTPEGLEAELEYVRLRKAERCVVAIDNADDPGWPAIKRLLAGYHTFPLVTLPNSTGLALIVMGP